METGPGVSVTSSKEAESPKGKIRVGVFLCVCFVCLMGWLVGFGYVRRFCGVVCFGVGFFFFWLVEVFV